MKFEERKKQVLKKLEQGIDKSRKGSIDEPIKNLVWLINSLEYYYTTSSCSGRIMLQSSALKGKKWENEWYFVSHDLIDDVDMIWNELNHDDVWLRMDAAILHIACKSIEDAEKMLIAARDAGFKRAGIISLKNLIIEAISTEHIEMPLVVDGKKLIDVNALKIIIDEANKRLQRTHEKIKKFEMIIKERFLPL